jgi:hypothetical protein
MITCHKQHLIARCKERGYNLADVMDCVIKQDGDMWTIDAKHAAYPHAKKTTMPKSTKKIKKCGGCKKKLTKSLIQKSIIKSKQTKQIKLQELRDKLDKK